MAHHPAGQMQVAVTDALSGGRVATTAELHAAVARAGFRDVSGGDLLLSEVAGLLTRMQVLGRVVGVNVAGEMLWSKPKPAVR